MQYLRHLSLGLCFFLLTSGLSAINPQQVRYHVKPTGSDSNNGTSWGTAYQTLQKALNTASAGDEIWVAAGTYFPTEYPDPQNSTDPRDRAFFRSTDIKLYGGFNGTESLLSQQDPETNVTILSGDFLQNDNVSYNSNGAVNISGNTENAYHILITEGLSSQSVLDGFRFQGGNADGSGQITYQGSFISQRRGGGVFNQGSALQIAHCSFTRNSSQRGGSGVHYVGSGSSNKILSASTTDCHFFENQSHSIATFFCADFSLRNCIFQRNAFGVYWGDQASGKMDNCLFINNTSSRQVQFAYGGDVDITHCTFSGSSSYGIFAFAGRSEVINVSNCIFWGHQSSDIHKTSTSNTTIHVSHCLTQAGSSFASGNGIINNVDPQFVDPANGDFRLKSCSPAIDAGINDSIPAGVTTDLAGNPRRYSNGTVDMGAYEYQGAFASCCPTTVFVDSAAAGANDGSSWANAYTDLQDAINLVATSCPGIEIWVAKGTYFPTQDKNGNAAPTDPRDKTFYIDTDGIKIYGGFAGTETTKSQRVAGNETILSGDIGIQGDSTDNVYTVMYVDGSNSNTGISPNTWISGFTFIDGNADGSQSRGGGLFLDANRGICSPTISDCTFKENHADQGGAISVFGFYGTSRSEFLHCLFHRNDATKNGGAVDLYAGFTNAINDIRFINCQFTENQVESYGGAVRIVVDNLSSQVIQKSEVEFINCTLYNNKDVSPNFGTNGCGVYVDFEVTAVSFTNCIFWKNAPLGTASSSAKESIYINPSSSNKIQISHSIIEGAYVSGAWDGAIGTDEGGNLDEDPLFADPANGDLSLQQCSPAIDAGINDSIPAGVTTDLAGNPRRYSRRRRRGSSSGTVDMGAYEYQGSKPSPTMSCLSSETVQLDANGSYSLAASSLDNGSNGACGSLTFTIDGNATKLLDCSDFGTQTITLQATDQDNQAVGTCQVSVTVQDIQNPTARCQPATVSLDASGQASLAASQVDNGSSDNCQLSLSVSPSSFDCSQIGSQNVTLTVTDPAGNSASCAASVQVVDDLKPTFSCPQTPVDLQADAQGNVNIPDLSAQISPTDNCGSISSVSNVQGLRAVLGSCSPNNLEALSFRVVDGNGNVLEKTCQGVIRVQDAIKPVISCPSSPIQLVIPFDGATCQPGTASISLSDATQAGASVSDNIDTGVSFSQIDANSFSLSQVGQAGLSVTLRANDCFGNAADQACDVQLSAAPSFTAEWELNGGNYTVCPDDFPLSISLDQGTPACGSWSGDVSVSTNPLQLQASAFPDNDNDNLPDVGTYQITYRVGPSGAQTSKTLSLTVALTPSLSRQGCGSCNQIRMNVCQGAPAPDLQAFVQNNNSGYLPGATLHWYADVGNSQGAALPAAPNVNTANAGRQFFWVSQEQGGCEGDARRVRVWVRESSRAVLNLPTACSGTQIDLARHVSDLNGKATGYEFWDDVPGIGNLLGTVSASNGVVPTNQQVFVSLASQTTTYYAVPLNPFNCQVAGSDQLTVANSTLDPIANITASNGDLVQVSFNTTASQVVWYNLNNPNIGLIGPAGSGNISFTAQNSSSSPLTANLFAIAYDGGCASQIQRFSITVNPGGANRQAQGDYLSLQADRINAHDVRISWSIRYQQPLSHFVVEKWQGQGPLPEDYLLLNQESNWKALGEVEASGKEGSYAFTDPSGMRNQNYYRVRLVQPDGRSSWSEVVQVNMEYFHSDRFEVFPNPTRGVVQLRCPFEQVEGWSLQLSDQLGRVLRQQPIQEKTSRISLSDFAPGVYYLKIEGPEGKAYLKKVVRQ